MAKDIVARALALDKSGGGGGDSYTKSETNALLAGKADLIDGKVPAAQLPSYVDDVLEYESVNSFPVIGESGKIYVATNTNKTYRWSGSGYVEISESLALGETASTAYPGNKGKANADAITKKPGEITTGKQYTIDEQTVTAGIGAETFNDLTNNKAAGNYSHAEGLSTTAIGALSHAEGQDTKSSGTASHAEGQGTTALGYGSHAEGSGTTASKPQSHAEGLNTTASGNASHAEGASTTASGPDSHAEGAGTIASGNFSHAEGEGTKASSENQHVQGKYNVEDTNDTYAFIIGNGTADNARHNAFTIDWNGLIYVNGSSTGVDLTKKPGEITKGKQYTIDGQTVTAAECAEVFNSLTSNKASGPFSHAEGGGTTASGYCSHAEGAGTKSSGANSHAEGGGSTASGAQSHAECSSTASGNNSHAEGSSTASGNYSHAEGSIGTIASGNSSHAEGANTAASGDNSHAEGYGTKASSANQHVQGKFNVEDTNDKFAFIIGNGTSFNARHNAFSIDWNGLIYVNGSETGVNVSALASQATTYTKTEVDTLLADKADLSIFTPMTQAEYDALVTKTAPLYFIYEDGESS